MNRLGDLRVVDFEALVQNYKRQHLEISERRICHIRHKKIKNP